MKIIVNNIELYYEVIGHGNPLILVHGNGEDHHIFDKAVAVLKDYYTCYLIDSRGHGLSGKVDVYAYQTMAKDMIDFIEQLDLSNVTFYGFSDGGIIGLLVASQSDRIANLIVSGANLNPEGFKLRVYYQLKLAYMFNHDPKIKMMLDQPHIKDYELHKIKAKTLVLAGSNDGIKESHTIYIAHNIPGSMLRIIEHANHSNYIVNSRKIADIIIEFKNG